MRSFDPTHGYDVSALEQMIAKVEDIKASSKAGTTRLVVREKGKKFTHAIIDIDMKAARDLKSKEIYVFQVQERDDSSNPGFQRKRSAEFKAYDCHEAPDIYSPAVESSAKFNRFGSASRSGGGERHKF